jgi:lipid A 3-O-deacylase
VWFRKPPYPFIFSRKIRGIIVRKLLLTSAVVVSALFGVSEARAEGDLLSLGVGYYDIFDDEDAVDVRAEWRSGSDLFLGVKPFVGLEATTDAALYGLAGVYRDFPVAPNWYVTPSIGAGLYHDGDGKDLGDVVEFRSQIEVAYEFASRNRVALGLSHISNAGMDDNNPGVEVLNLYYHMPWN